MTEVEVTGSVPRLTRRDITSFVRRVLLFLERDGAIQHEFSEVSIAFVTDEEMKSLNRKFRRKNKTTDVLTFPTDESYANPSDDGRPLGDIVISLDRARRQAASENHALASEIRYLIVHGILHALGFDHEIDKGEMNALELRVREAVGLD